jgi:hypothetical protein
MFMIGSPWVEKAAGSAGSRLQFVGERDGCPGQVAFGDDPERGATVVEVCARVAATCLKRKLPAPLVEWTEFDSVPEGVLEQCEIDVEQVQPLERIRSDDEAAK